MDRCIPAGEHLPAGEHECRWAAAGVLAGTGFVVEAAGIEPEELALTMGVDPEPYIAGSRRVADR